MFESASRYYSIETATLTLADGRTLSYKRRRFLPQGKKLPLLLEVTLNEGDRLDLLTARTLGDPEQFWRLADANDTMNPPELESEAGRRLRVPVPQVEK